MRTAEQLVESCKRCTNYEDNNQHCTCPNIDCQFHGRCCVCLANHRDYSAKPLPHCLREVEGVAWTVRAAPAGR